MRKLSLFLAVALVATVFAFAAIPVGAAGEMVDVVFDNAPEGAAYDFTATMNVKTPLTSLLFTLAYPKADFMLVDIEGTSISAEGKFGGSAKLVDLHTVNKDTKSLWVREDIVFGTDSGNIATNSNVGVANRVGNTYGMCKVSFNAALGSLDAAIPAGDLIKVYFKKTASASTKPAESIKLVSSDNTFTSDHTITPNTLNNGLTASTAKYNAGDFGGQKSGILLSVPGVATQEHITADKVAWTNNITEGPTKVDVTDLTVAKDTVNLKMGATTEETVGVTIVPDNATDKTYSVESSASGVATAEVVAGGVKITAVSEGTANVTVTSTDNANAKKVIAVNVAKADPTNYTVAVNKTGLGIATVSAGSVAAGGTVDLRVLPVLGNKVSSIMMNSQDITADFNAFLGGKKTYTINENTTFTVTFASIIGAEAEKPFVAPDAFVGEYTKPGTTGAQKSAAAFGKIAAPVASNLVTEYGVKLEKDGAPYTKEVGGVTYGPKFEATSNVNDQFGVLFIGLEAGTYTATTYVVYDNGGSAAEVEGYAVTFTVQ